MKNEHGISWAEYCEQLTDELRQARVEKYRADTTLDEAIRSADAARRGAIAADEVLRNAESGSKFLSHVRVFPHEAWLAARAKD